MTEKLLLSPSPTLAAWLRPLPADWGWYDCQKLTDKPGGTCSECGEKVADKYGAASSCTGIVIGRRSGPDAAWTWSGLLCRSCDTAHAIADGYGNK